VEEGGPAAAAVGEAAEPEPGAEGALAGDEAPVLEALDAPAAEDLEGVER